MAEFVKSSFFAYRRELQAFLKRRLGDRQLAADLLQDVFVRVVERPRNSEEENARAYLYRVATNLAIDHERQSARRAQVFGGMEGAGATPDGHPAADRVLESRAQLERVYAALASLPPLTQEIFRLDRVESLTYRQVAARLDISESSVQKHLARALSHALRALEDPP
ncbi:sigma-70 family RNA polymerase sigma factor [Myxococcus sp. SDU36]|uniref:RNA polymerase sigma factor n=1 Tax=Myxococcus sp. SDU36 TaxID=2831967 RepID=UPI002542863B|nr:sigma-70 family RNA polymerase sigma factor [Myxococcus sp. SDU36]WIG94862.1 sigma-70 family RNA polymerase sigma factor [Myxococcus sp. SDU36]